MAMAAHAKSIETILFILLAGGAAFAAYFSMYTFRKRFTAAQFADSPEWLSGHDYKSALVIAQVVGYALSNVIGVRLMAELDAKGRAGTVKLAK